MTKAGSFTPFSKFVKNWQNKGIWAWGSKLLKSNNICLYNLLGPEFSRYGDKDTFYPPDTGRVVSHGRFISYFQGDKGRSEYLCTCCFLK